MNGRREMKQSGGLEIFVMFVYDLFIGRKVKNNEC